MSLFDESVGEVGRREFESRETRSARLACSRSLRSRERGYGHPKAEGDPCPRKLREQWAGANSNHARLAPLASLALVRFAHENAVTATRRPKEILVRGNCGSSGPARIRIAVTATRRPKDTKLPHRPARKRSDGIAFNSCDSRPDGDAVECGAVSAGVALFATRWSICDLFKTLDRGDSSGFQFVLQLSTLPRRFVSCVVVRNPRFS